MPDHPEREVQRPLALTNPYMHGPDVNALQEAIDKELDRAKLHGHVATDGDFGPETKRLANKVAEALGLHPAGEGHAGPIFTQAEQKLIRNPADRTDAQVERGKRRVKQMQDDEHPSTGIRARILAYCQWGVSNEGSIHYQQSRPFPINTPRTLPLYTDCSGFATLAYEDAGGPNPNGSTPRGYGFTGTILSACRHIPKSALLPGDLIVYGPGSGQHVVIAKEPGTVADPMTISHGQEAGPMLVRNSVEIGAHAAPVTYCQIL